MGVIESAVHAALARYAISDKFYFKEREKIICREIFSCSLDTALTVIKNIIKVSK